MKVDIDEKACLKQKLTPTEVLIALAVRSTGNFEDAVNNMINRQILVNLNGKMMVTQHWNDVVDEVICDSSDKEIDEERLMNLALKMIELYPQGKMRDRFGKLTPYYYRCNKSEVFKKLKKFFTIYGDTPDEDILDATKRYVASFNGNYSGMRLIKYFILKDDVKPSENGNGHVEQISDLATFLENKEEGEVGVNTSDDWLMSARN